MSEPRLAFESGVDDEVVKLAAVESDTAELVDQRNRWYETGELGKELDEEVQRRSARLLLDVMLYVTHNVDFNTKKGIMRAVIRVISLIWVLSPDLMRCKPVKGKDNTKVATLEDLAKPLGVTKCWVSMVAEDVSVCFGFFSRNQKTGESRENYAKAAKAGWEKRRVTYNDDKTRKKTSR